MNDTMRQRGFTLMEVMIVVVIIGVLAAIAYPGYQRQVEQSRRTDAHTVLTRAAQRLERCYTATTSYQNCITGNKVASDNGLYAVNVDTPTPNAFALTAVRIAASAHDTCNNLTLNHLGVRGARGGTEPVDVKACW
ncbi:MAG: type IV pilin protein [Aquisalimonadaceae bacterium]